MDNFNPRSLHGERRAPSCAPAAPQRISIHAPCTKILVEPLLYRYAKAGKQISAIDIKLLDTPVSKTNDIIVLQGFLLRKIEAMKSDRTADRIILYDDIYKIFGINEPQKVKNQLQRIRKYMDTMLEYWKGEKYITDFIVNKKGKSCYSVTIYI